jgi:hypothetical protein
MSSRSVQWSMLYAQLLIFCSSFDGSLVSPFPYCHTYAVALVNLCILFNHKTSCAPHTSLSARKDESRGNSVLLEALQPSGEEWNMAVRTPVVYKWMHWLKSVVVEALCDRLCGISGCLLRYSICDGSVLMVNNGQLNRLVWRCPYIIGLNVQLKCGTELLWHSSCWKLEIGTHRE